MSNSQDSGGEILSDVQDDTPMQSDGTIGPENENADDSFSKWVEEVDGGKESAGKLPQTYSLLQESSLEYESEYPFDGESGQSSGATQTESFNFDSCGSDDKKKSDAEGRRELKKDVGGRSDSFGISDGDYLYNCSESSENDCFDQWLQTIGHSRATEQNGVRNNYQNSNSDCLDQGEPIFKNDERNKTHDQDTGETHVNRGVNQSKDCNIEARLGVRNLDSSTVDQMNNVLRGHAIPSNHAYSIGAPHNGFTDASCDQLNFEIGESGSEQIPDSEDAGPNSVKSKNSVHDSSNYSAGVEKECDLLHFDRVPKSSCKDKENPDSNTDQFNDAAKTHPQDSHPKGQPESHGTSDCYVEWEGKVCRASSPRNERVLKKTETNHNFTRKRKVLEGVDSNTERKRSRVDKNEVYGGDDISDSNLDVSNTVKFVLNESGEGEIQVLRVQERLNSIDSHNQSGNENHSNESISEPAKEPEIILNDYREESSIEISDGDRKVGEKSSETDYSNPDEPDVKELRNWIVSHRIPHSASDELLKILRARRMPNLPASTKTFLEKQTRFIPEEMEALDGSTSEFIYLGMERKLQLIVKPTVHALKVLELSFGIDGFNPFKSSLCSVWPILCKIHSKEFKYKVFTVAVFAGKSEPKSADEFLKKFVEELNRLLKNGIEIDGVKFIIKVKFFICDTPARAFLKFWVGHTSSIGCERSFDQPDCHHGVSILIILEELDFIYQFILDPMHSVYLGPAKRIFDYLLGNPNKKESRKSVKFSYALKLELKRRTEMIKGDRPDEFPRKMRPTDTYHKYKAVEWKFMLLYASLVVSKKNHQWKFIQTLLASEHGLQITIWRKCGILCNKIDYCVPPNHLVVQYCNRIEEAELYLTEADQIDSKALEILIETKVEVHKIRYRGMILGNSHPNSTVLTKNKNIVEIQRFEYVGTKLFVVIKKFKKKSFLDTIWDVHDLNIWEVTHPSLEESTIPLDSIVQKFVRLQVNFPAEEEKRMFVIPLLH
ncbi:hypothetical protein QAD02_002498 [Eretmocerus hayati]|uniref:Uncharacterized protein n=1 Tax=Eretmocerus hayati TaxID=131215 RepID=A0ACC2NLR6_9HYME|nr:hypothetical protein QAD02_002498 [Eretmocerus hayati]